tara:strand:+ start:88 stop:543 length:456 start_codon:yes stop_codon:yes gene_type:complete
MSVDWLLEIYPWVKALHIIAVISWMVGMLYLPRLFVYHSEAPIGSDKSETFKVMERRLMRVIMNPAMIVSAVFGVLLFLTPGVVDWYAWWVYVKIILVVFLMVLHGVFALWRKRFEEDKNKISARTFRIANEGPTILMIGIVIMVIIRPGA